MQNWMITLEERSDEETAKITIQLIAGILIFGSICAGNWYLLT